MKFRIRTDLIFENETESDLVWTALKRYLKNNDIRNVAEEKSFIDYHECYHDEQKPCINIEHFEKE